MYHKSTTIPSKAIVCLLVEVVAITTKHLDAS